MSPRTLARLAPVLLTGGGLLALAGWALLEARDFPEEAARFPNLVLGATAILAVLYLITEVRARLAHDAARRDALSEGEVPSVDPDRASAAAPETATGPRWLLPHLHLGPNARGVVVALAAVVLVWSLPRIGFIVAAATLLVLLPLLLGYRRPWIVVPFAAVLVTVLYQLFFDYLRLRDLPWQLS